ncbi:hypothetical protein B0H19DRAFT_1241891 [Mycena capillaripes]|nr:hypothetical protein B0H19DRAFT_1241891 [Mycena capillaripes]
MGAGIHSILRCTHVSSHLACMDQNHGPMFPGAFLLHYYMILDCLVSRYHPLTFGAHLCPSGSFRNLINTHAPPHRKAASPLPLPGPSPCRGAPLDLREVLAAGQRCGRVRPARTHDADAKRRVDANKDVFVVIAHDETLPDVIGPFPVLLYDWKAKGLKDRVLKAFVDEANPAFRFNDKV